MSDSLARTALEILFDKLDRIETKVDETGVLVKEIHDLLLPPEADES